jgi:CHAT domain-containing protein
MLRYVDEEGNHHYLMERNRVSYLPSASFLTDLMKEQEEAPQELLAFGNADGTLPNAELEVDLIAQLFDRPYVGKCDSARKDRFLQMANDYALIHLATHGILAYDPRFSHIVLAPEFEGNLTVREIFGLSGYFQKTSLVTLSACETAVEAEPEKAGMELVTLSNAFKVAGVPTTIASLWEIADRSTALLMQDFYKNLKDNNMDKLDALRHAQLSMLDHENYAHPYYWAPFVLIGDWQ